ncbi:MAG: toxin HipA [Pseudomonadaceae bacterium]|nr:toxin HipA [Pseudomonadaceae bacterium]
MFEQLTIQTFVDGEWFDAADLSFADTAQVEGKRCALTYKAAYLGHFLDDFDSLFEPVLSVNAPMNWSPEDYVGFPAFILDIIPAGAAKRSLLRRFNDSSPAEMDTDLFLLGQCTPAPIGNLRIKESVERLETSHKEGFERDEIINRDTDFLEYAYESGAALGGATGAQGEAPKLVLTEAHDGLFYADAMLADEGAKAHWLVKFPRNTGTLTDKNILRAEYLYYKAVARLGLNTVPVDGLALEEANKPSLWMPRFDRRVSPEGVERIPVESIYSIRQITMGGANQNHEDVMRCLIELWVMNGQGAEVEDLIFEYIRRDLLNRILGNSDNHGRNMAIHRYKGSFSLAPIYDLAPMVLDSEVVVRVTKWLTEVRGYPDWRQACNSFTEFAPADVIFDRLRAAAQEFRALPDLLTELPDEVRRSNAIPLNNLDMNLQRWGLL